MAEAIGAIASVITISKTLVAAVEAVRSLYQAEAELDKLKERLGNFTDVVNEISCHVKHTPAPAVQNSLMSARNTLNRLNDIFQSKMMRYSKGTQKIRRKIWLRNKSKIMALQAELDLHRADLVAALSASALASNARAEMMLNVIGSDTALLRQSSSNIGARLGQIERELSNTISLASLNGNVILRLEQLAAVVAPGQSSVSNRGPLPAYMSISSVFDSSVPLIQPSNKISKGLEDSGVIVRENCMTQTEGRKAYSPRLRSLLDCSSSVSPATYTTYSPVPSLIITSFWQTQQTRTSRTNHYHVLFSKTSNVYHQLTVSISFPVSSKYWAVSKIAKDQYQCREGAFLVTLISLPQTLQNQVWQMLAARETLAEQTHVSLAFTSEGEHDLDSSQAPRLFQKPIFRPRPSALCLDDRSVITSLEDLGCALYLEREVQPLAPFEPFNRFVSIVAGNLVEEVKCTRSPPYPSFLYGIQAFHCLDGIPGVLNLQGVVIDSSRKHIRSYLLTLPKTKCKFFLDYLSEKGSRSWEDQEIWARRLVEAIRQVHARGYTVGSLQRRRLPILVDAYEMLYISRLEHITVFSNHQNVVLPPEYHLDTCVPGRLTPEAKAPRVTPKLDIYQLGSCLWVLAQSWASRSTPSQVYHDVLDGTPKNIPEHGSAELSPLPDCVPAYYRNIVEACRRHDPSTRPAANQLLAMFSSRQSDPKQIGRRSDYPLMDVQTYLQCGVANPGCDICAGVIKESFFHCNTCAAGDYDICEKCFEAGEHCLEEDHLLIKLESSWKCPTAEEYISNVKSNGAREVIKM